MDEIIYIADPDTYELVFVNQAFKHNWGDGKDVIGKKCYAVIQGRERPCPFCTNDIIFKNKREQTHVWEFQNEATGRWFRCTDKVIRWVDGRKLRFELAADITEQKELSERQRHLDKLGSLGQLTAGVAHELNNPLMGIINYVQFCLSQTDESEEIHPVLLDIERETRRCTEIVQNLLTFSRSGGPGSDFRKASPFRILDRALRILNYQILEGGFKIEKKIEPGLPRIHVHPERIQQVIVNLLTNAFDANQARGKTKIKIRLHKKDRYLILEIEDEGGGIADGIREKIFDPFFSTKPTGEGTGLGLATSSAIVVEHGGNISFQSRKGIGTIMKVQIPIKRNKGEKNAEKNTGNR